MVYIMMVMNQKTMTLRIRLMKGRTSAKEAKKERMSQLWARKAKKKLWLKQSLQRKKSEPAKRSPSLLLKKQKTVIPKSQRPARTKNNSFLKLSWALAPPEQMAETKRNLAWKWKKEAANPTIKNSLMRRPNAFLINSWINLSSKSRIILSIKRAKTVRLKKPSCADLQTTSLLVPTVQFQADSRPFSSTTHLSWKSRDRSDKTEFSNLLRTIWNRIRLSRLELIIQLIPIIAWWMRSSSPDSDWLMVDPGTACGPGWFVRVSSGIWINFKRLIILLGPGTSATKATFGETFRDRGEDTEKISRYVRRPIFSRRTTNVGVTSEKWATTKICT